MSPDLQSWIGCVPPLVARVGKRCFWRNLLLTKSSVPDQRDADKLLLVACQEFHAHAVAVCSSPQVTTFTISASIV